MGQAAFPKQKKKIKKKARPFFPPGPLGEKCGAPMAFFEAPCKDWRFPERGGPRHMAITAAGKGERSPVAPSGRSNAGPQHVLKLAGAFFRTCPLRRRSWLFSFRPR